VKENNSTILTLNSITDKQYDEAVISCKDIFMKKTQDYGTSWRVLRLISITDQIFIKAKRVRTIQEKQTQKVSDDISSEFKGIVNYAVIGLIQLNLGNAEMEEMPAETVEHDYDHQIKYAKNTMLDKNHDYGEAWRDMSEESFIDLILMKLNRIRQILANNGETLISEGIDANFVDILNYALFALILMSEQLESKSL
jgi:hypothetical protein